MTKQPVSAIRGLLLALAVSSALPGVAQPRHDPAPPLREFQVVTIADDNTAIALRRCSQQGSRNDCMGEYRALAVPDLGVQAIVKTLRPGDHVAIMLKDGDGPNLQFPSLQFIEVLRKSLFAREQPNSFPREFWTFSAWAALLLLIAFALTRGHPLMLIVGMDNRYSNSKFQLALWFWVLIASYLTVFSLRISTCGWDFAGGINIPENLMVLSGLSALSFGGAKAITTAKSNAAQAGLVDAEAFNPAVLNPAAVPNLKAALPALESVVKPFLKMSRAGGEDFWRDLVQNDVGEFDFGDFQMLIVTLLAVGTYLVVLFHFLNYFDLRRQITLPDVDTTVLTAFGVGQGAYLTKKAAGNLGTS